MLDAKEEWEMDRRREEEWKEESEEEWEEEIRKIVEVQVSAQYSTMHQHSRKITSMRLFNTIL